MSGCPLLSRGLTRGADVKLSKNHTQGCFRKNSRGARVPGDSSSGTAMDGRTQGVPRTIGQLARGNAAEVGPATTGKERSQVIFVLCLGQAGSGRERGLSLKPWPSFDEMVEKYATLDGSISIV